jgi:glutathione S-transferase
MSRISAVDFDNNYLAGESFLEFKSDKNKAAFGFAPVYPEGEFYLAQGPAIMQYLARKHNRVPNSESLETQAIHDSICLSAEDFRVGYFACFKKAFTDEEKAAAHKNFFENTFQGRWGGNFEALLKKYATEGFFGGKEPNHADIALFDVLEAATNWIQSFSLESFPLLDAHTKAIRSRPNLKKYFENRPKE